MKNRANVEQKIEEQLTNYKATITRLRDKSRNSSGEARVTIEKKIEELDEMVRLAEARLSELRDAKEESWEGLKTEVENYWNSLGRELKAYDHML